MLSGSAAAALCAVEAESHQPQQRLGPVVAPPRDLDVPRHRDFSAGSFTKVEWLEPLDPLCGISSH